jgi:hypothetical protein
VRACEGAERGFGVPASDRAGVWGGAPREDVQMQKMLKQLGGMTGLAGGGKKARRRAMQMMRQR